MKLTATIKLICEDSTKKELLDTIHTCNTIATEISEFCFQEGVFKQFNIHALFYHQIRYCYYLPSQFVIRTIAKVADAYKLDTESVRKFNPLGSIAYDSRILTFGPDFVSIHTGKKRVKVPFKCGKKQRELLKYQRGETDLVFKNNEFFLYATCDAPEQTIKESTEFLGVDRGVNNIAADSLGTLYSGSRIISARKKHTKLRRKLQQVQTKSAKRKLAKNKRKESRFAKDVNHQISKKIVETAQRHNLGISLEDLKGINKSTTVRKGHRYIRQSWSFYDLEQKIVYKAQLKGIEVKKVDPRYSSRECFECGYISKKNRKSQSIFLCQSCGHTDHADINASRVLSRRAAVNRPIVGSAEVVNSCRSTPYKPIPLGRGS